MSSAARVLSTGPYTREEAAGLLRVSVATLDRERLAGKIACLRVRGRVLFTWDAIEQYKTSHAVPVTEPTARTSTSAAAPGGRTSATVAASPSAPRTQRKRSAASVSTSPPDVRALLGLRPRKR